MSTEITPSEPTGGYLSAESKRRFTLVAGILGAVFFLAQFLLPMLIMLPFMMSMTTSEFKTPELDQGALLGDQLWFVERTIKPNWRDLEKTAGALALARVRLTDLSEAGAAVPLVATSGTAPSLLSIGQRLWVIGEDAVSCYENGSLTRLGGVARPPRASRPFAHGGRPAVISLGTAPTLQTLQAEAGRAEWASRSISLGLPAESGALRALQAVEGAGSLYLFAQLCTEDPSRCTLSYRELTSEKWLSLVSDVCSCATWTAIAVGERPAVVLSEQGRGRAPSLRVVTVAAGGPEMEPVALAEPGKSWVHWRPFAAGGRLVLVAEGMPGSLRLAEVAGGRVVRTTRKSGSSFPFGPHMMLYMWVPQLLPIVLSLVLAFVLTIQMRRHRVPDYAFGAERRRFASLWQRAIAQLVDLIPFLAGLVFPMVAFWRLFSDPETVLESGPTFPLWIFGLMAAAFVWALLVFVVLSYFEGRSGKTPGKWLVGIRVVGTDLQPCGFGRAFLRNLLTFADGFFSFMVGALLVALTENWQRLGDMAARTIVVVDEKRA